MDGASFFDDDVPNFRTTFRAGSLRLARRARSQTTDIAFFTRDDDHDATHRTRSANRHPLRTMKEDQSVNRPKSFEADAW